MSGWQAYVDYLIGQGNIAYAVIAGQNGSIWAQSANLNVTYPEILELVKCMKAETSPTGSISLAGNKYMVTRIDKDAFFGAKGKLTACAFNSGNGQAMVIAISDKDKGHTPGSANNIVVKFIEDYLTKNGY